MGISGTILSISLYGDGVPAKTVDLSTATGFGVNIGNSDLTTDDNLRTLTLQDDFQIVGDGASPEVYIETGSLGGGRVIVNTNKSSIYHGGLGGTNEVFTNANGIQLFTPLAASRSITMRADSIIEQGTVNGELYKFYPDPTYIYPSDYLYINGESSTGDLEITWGDETGTGKGSITATSTGDVTIGTNSTAEGTVSVNTSTNGAPALTLLVTPVGEGFNALALQQDNIYLDTETGDPFKVNAPIEFSNIITPPDITVSQNDYNPTDLDDAHALLLTSTANVNITGLVSTGFSLGRQILISNRGTFNITLVNESASSSAANRFSFPGNYTISPKCAVILEYLTGTNRWIIVSGGSPLNVIGSANQVFGINNAGTGYEWKTIQGTVNQVNVTNGVGTYTLSTPQDIHTAATPTFSDLTLTDDLFVTDDATIGTGNSISVINMVATTANTMSLSAIGGLTIGSTSGNLTMNSGAVGGYTIWDVGTSGNLLQMASGNTSGTSTTTNGVRTDYIMNDGSALESGHLISVNRYQSRGVAATIRSGAQMVTRADATWSNTSAPAEFVFSTTPIGGTVLQDRLIINSGGEIDILSNNSLRLFDTDNSNHYRIKSPVNDSLTTNATWILPRIKGTNGQVLKIRGDSLLYWGDDNAGSSVNIFNSDGTQDDADRYFTIDSTRTFAMGQFPNFPASTWGRGFYYDPSAGDGIRILNKDGSNTSRTYVEVDPFGVNIRADYLDADVSTSYFATTENATYTTSVDRTSDTYGLIDIALITNTNEEQVALRPSGKTTTPTVVMYLGDGYVGSQYGEYTSRAWGLQTKISGGGFDWIQVLLPDTGTDTTGNNLNFYNRKYYWSNETPSFTNLDTMVHVWIGNGTNATPDFVEISNIIASAKNIYNSNGTTTQNTRTLNILESLRFVGSADLGVNPYPFQVISTGNEPLIQLWKGNTDSVYLYQSDVEYVYGSTARFILQSQDDLFLDADSVIVQGTESKTKIKRLAGFTSSGTIKYFDGDAANSGDIIVSNGTDWTVGSITANESNVPHTIRITLSAKQDNYNPSGLSLTKSQTIRVKADASFRFITGLEAATRDGVQKTFINDSTNCFGLAKLHTDSDVDNRFNVTRDVIIYPGMSVTMQYDSVSQKWNLISTNQNETTFASYYDVKTQNTGVIISDNFHFDGSTRDGGSITRSSAGNITDSKTGTTNFNTGTSTNAGVACLISYNGIARFNSNEYYLRTYTRVRFEDLSSATEDYDFTFGYGEFSGIDTTADAKKGVYVTYKREENSGGFVLKSHDGTTQTSVNAGSAIAADTWYEIEVIYYPFGEAACFINGVRYSKTNNIPTSGSTSHILMVEKDAGTTSRTAYINTLEERTVVVNE